MIFIMTKWTQNLASAPQAVEVQLEEIIIMS